MSKKKILLVKIPGMLSQETLDECAKRFMDAIEKTGIFMHDSAYEFREVEVDGIYWEDK